ncbi:unnamed protein product [Urochloa humidicola]
MVQGLELYNRLYSLVSNRQAAEVCQLLPSIQGLIIPRSLIPCCFRPLIRRGGDVLRFTAVQERSTQPANQMAIGIVPACTPLHDKDGAESEVDPLIGYGTEAGGDPVPSAHATRQTVGASHTPATRGGPGQDGERADSTGAAQKGSSTAGSGSAAPTPGESMLEPPVRL